MVEQDKVHGVVGGHMMNVIMLRTWKRRKRKTKWAQGKGDIHRAIFVFDDRDTTESVITFRINGRTIKRGALIAQLDHLVPLGVGILALHFRPSAQLVRSD